MEQGPGALSAAAKTSGTPKTRSIVTPLSTFLLRKPASIDVHRARDIPARQTVPRLTRKHIVLRVEDASIVEHARIRPLEIPNAVLRDGVDAVRACSVLLTCSDDEATRFQQK
jgi:hypothetical protein